MTEMTIRSNNVIISAVLASQEQPKLDVLEIKQERLDEDGEYAGRKMKWWSCQSEEKGEYWWGDSWM